MKYGYLCNLRVLFLRAAQFSVVTKFCRTWYLGCVEHFIYWIVLLCKQLQLPLAIEFIVDAWSIQMKSAESC